MLSILSWIADGGVLEVEQISSLDGTTFPEDLKPIISFLETFVKDHHLPVQLKHYGSGKGSQCSLICSVSDYLSI